MKNNELIRVSLSFWPDN